MKKLLILLIILLVSQVMPAMAQAQSADTQKLDNIRQLLTMMGADKLRDTMMDQMLDGIKKSFPALSKGEQAGKIDRLMELFREEMKKADFTTLTIELYDKYFTTDEIKGLIQFYSSPVGQKAIMALPTLNQESMRRGMELGQAAGQRAVTRWIDEFPELEKALPAGK